MSRLTACFAALVLACATLGQNASAQPAPRHWTYDTDSNDNFGRCSQISREHAQRTIRACGRIIGERVSSAHSAGAHYFRGLMYATIDQPDRAREDFLEAYRLFDVGVGPRARQPHLYMNRAAAASRLGRYDEAIADYEAALAVFDSGFSDVGTRVRSGLTDERLYGVADLHAALGGVYFRLGDWPNAIRAYDEAARISPKEATYQALRCEARGAANIEVDVGEQACQEALRLADDDRAHLFSRGLFQFTQGRYAEAYADFASALEEDEENHLARYGRGLAALRLGQTAEGQSDIARAEYELDPYQIGFYAQAGLTP